MIRELLTALRAEGIDVPEPQARNVEQRIQREHGGQTFYIPRLPRREAGLRKLERINRVAQFGTTVPVTYIARELGVTVQHVRRLRRVARGG